MSTINVVESLRKIDNDTCNKYNLLTMYEACNLNDEEKGSIAKMINDNESPEALQQKLNLYFDNDDISDIDAFGDFITQGKFYNMIDEVVKDMTNNFDTISFDKNKNTLHITKDGSELELSIIPETNEELEDYAFYLDNNYSEPHVFSNIDDAKSDIITFTENFVKDKCENCIDINECNDDMAYKVYDVFEDTNGMVTAKCMHESTNTYTDIDLGKIGGTKITKKINDILNSPNFKIDDENKKKLGSYIGMTFNAVPALIPDDDKFDNNDGLDHLFGDADGSIGDVGVADGGAMGESIKKESFEFFEGERVQCKKTGAVGTVIEADVEMVLVDWDDAEIKWVPKDQIKVINNQIQESMDSDELEDYLYTIANGEVDSIPDHDDVLDYDDEVTDLLKMYDIDSTTLKETPSGFLPGMGYCPSCGGTRFNTNTGLCIDCEYDESDWGYTNTDDYDDLDESYIPLDKVSKEIEQYLNYHLGSNEDYIKVNDIQNIDKDTVAVEYEVHLSIPIGNDEYESDTEYRSLAFRYRNGKWEPKLEESLQETDEDGWGDRVEQILEPTIEKVEDLAYEVRNTVRGANTNCDTTDELADYVDEVIEDFEDANSSLRHEAKEIDESKSINEDALDDQGISKTRVDIIAKQAPNSKFYIDKNRYVLGKDLLDYFDTNEILTYSSYETSDGIRVLNSYKIINRVVDESKSINEDIEKNITSLKESLKEEYSNKGWVKRWNFLDNYYKGDLVISKISSPVDAWHVEKVAPNGHTIKHLGNYKSLEVAMDAAEKHLIKNESKSINEDLVELNFPSFNELRKQYKNYTTFKDKEKNSGLIRDLCDQLENKEVSYDIYNHKKDNGMTIFYDDFELVEALAPYKKEESKNIIATGKEARKYLDNKVNNTSLEDSKGYWKIQKDLASGGDLTIVNDVDDVPRDYKYRFSFDDVSTGTTLNMDAYNDYFNWYIVDYSSDVKLKESVSGRYVRFSYNDIRNIKPNSMLKESSRSNYNIEDGWTDEDIKLHQSIDWKSRNYMDFPVTTDSFVAEAILYGEGKDKVKNVKMIKYLVANPFYPPYYAPEENPFKEYSNVVGPMYDGRKHGSYQIQDRYETQELYDTLFESAVNNDKSKIKMFDCPRCHNKTLVDIDNYVVRNADVDYHDQFVCEECGAELLSEPQFDGTITFITESLQEEWNTEWDNIGIEIEKAARKQHIGVDFINTDSSVMGAFTATFEINNGDWKHDHLAFDSVVKKYLANNEKYALWKIDTNQIGSSDDDSYSAEHVAFIVPKNKIELLNNMKGLFAESINSANLTDCPACGDTSFDTRRGRCTKCNYKEALDESRSIKEDLKKEFKKQLQDELYDKFIDLARTPEWGYENIKEIDEFINPIIEIEDYKGDYDNDIKVELRAELNYPELEEVCTTLDKVIQKYDKQAYFEPVTSGIADAYMKFPKKLESFTESEILSHCSNTWEELIKFIESSGYEVDSINRRNPSQWITAYKDDNEYEIEINKYFDGTYEVIKADLVGSITEANDYIKESEDYPEVNIHFVNDRKNGLVGISNERALAKVFNETGLDKFKTKLFNLKNVSIGDIKDTFGGTYFQRHYGWKAFADDNYLYVTKVPLHEDFEDEKNHQYVGKKFQYFGKDSGSNYGKTFTVTRAYDTQNGVIVRYDSEDGHQTITAKPGEYKLLKGSKNESTKSIVTSRSMTEAIDNEDGDELISAEQEFDSAATSINSNKLPAVYNMVKFNPGDVVVDFGGGRFDNAVNYLKDQDVTLLVYDPYNRSAEHNKEVLKVLREHGGADAAVNSNVLNVIKEPEARNAVLQNIKKITKKGAPIYITVYEGTGKGNEGPTKSGYQLNRKTGDYMDEIGQVFSNVKRKGKLITAINESYYTGSDLRQVNLDALEYFIEFEDIYPFPKGEFLATDWKELRDGVAMGMDDDLEIAEGIMEYLQKEIDFNNKHEEIYEDDPQAELTLEIYNAVKKEYEKTISKMELSETLSDRIKNNELDYDEEIDAYFAEEDNIYVQFQDRQTNTYRSILGPKDNRMKIVDRNPRVSSNTWARIWKDGELVKSFEGPKYKVRADVIKYLDDNNKSEVLEETSYGGAFDIEDDQYFTKEEIVDVAEKVCEHLDETYPDKFNISDVYMETPTIIHVEVISKEGNWASANAKIDMRKIKKPSDIMKYDVVIGDLVYNLRQELEDLYKHDSLKEDLDPSIKDPQEDDSWSKASQSQETIYLTLDDVIVDVTDDSWDYSNINWAANEDDDKGEWYSEDGVYIGDDVLMSEYFDELIEEHLPEESGKYKLSCDAELAFDINGIEVKRDYFTTKDGYDYDEEKYVEDAEATFNRKDSKLFNIKFIAID